MQSGKETERRQLKANIEHRTSNTEHRNAKSTFRIRRLLSLPAAAGENFWSWMFLLRFRSGATSGACHAEA
jgi:hypothetical protein